MNNSWIVWLKKFLLYNMLLEPFIIVIYLPYYIFFLNYSKVQLIKWAYSTIPFGLIASFILTPIEMWMVHLLDEHYKEDVK